MEALSPIPQYIQQAMNLSAKIAALGRLCGISAEYWDNFGRRHRTSQSTYRALLTAMGVPWEDPGELDRELAHRRLTPYDRLLPPVLVTSQASRPGRVLAFPWTPAPQPLRRFEVRLQITDEAGRQDTWKTVVQGPDPPVSRRAADGCRTSLELTLPARLDLGYHDLHLQVSAGPGQETGRARLIVAPNRAYLPPGLAAGKRLWGFNVPLYALRSTNNWGMGDFRDLLALTDWTASLGAAFVGVNPLHAPALQVQGVPSPYSPTSRLWFNFLYLDLEGVPEMTASPEAQALLASPEFRRQAARLRREPLVPYPGVFRLKRRVLEVLYRTFLEQHGPPEAPCSPRGQEFARYLAAGDDSLAKFGRYQALADFLKQADWRRWPRDYRSPDSPAVAEFSRQHRPTIHLHQYGQWLAANQLQGVYHRARHQGLPYSLYQDLALGAAPGGSDTWAHLVLPAVTLASWILPINMRMVRSGMLDVLNQDYIRTARAKGLMERKVLIKHAFKNAAIPVITITGMQLGALLGGAVVTETVFAWPGLGRLAVDSIRMGDYPVVQAIVVVFALFVVIGNLAADILAALIDPRIRLE